MTASAATDGRSRFSNARASGSSKKASAHAPKRTPSVGIRISRNAIAARSAAPIGISRRSDRFQPGIAVESCMKHPSLSMKWARLREKSSRKRAGWGSAFSRLGACARSDSELASQVFRLCGEPFTGSANLAVHPLRGLPVHDPVDRRGGAADQRAGHESLHHSALHRANPSFLAAANR